MTGDRALPSPRPRWRARTGHAVAAGVLLALVGAGAAPARAAEPAPPVVSIAGAPARGAREAPLVIIEYSDYQ